MTLREATMVLLSHVESWDRLTDGCTTYTPDGWRDRVDDATDDGERYYCTGTAIYHVDGSGYIGSVPVVMVSV